MVTLPSEMPSTDMPATVTEGPPEVIWPLVN
jgi:hypothetical protein